MTNNNGRSDLLTLLPRYLRSSKTYERTYGDFKRINIFYVLCMVFVVTTETSVFPFSVCSDVAVEEQIAEGSEKKRCLSMLWMITKYNCDFLDNR